MLVAVPDVIPEADEIEGLEMTEQDPIIHTHQFALLFGACARVEN